MPKGIYPRRKESKKVVPKRTYRRRAVRSVSADGAPNYDEPVRFECQSCTEKDAFQQQQAEALRLAYTKIDNLEQTIQGYKDTLVLYAIANINDYAKDMSKV